MNDRDSVRRTLEGDKVAFGELVVRYQVDVLRFVLRTVGDEQIASDIAQEVWLQAFLNLSKLRDPSAFKSWLFGISANLCRNHFRKHPLSDPLPDDSPLPSDHPSPERITEERDLYDRVRGAVDDLSPRNRDAVLLYYVDGLTISEVSALLGISATAVKGRLHKSRETIKATMQKEQNMIPVTVADVFQHGEHNILMLLSVDESRYVPIWVGDFEAITIARFAVGEMPPTRPLTYTLMANMLTSMGGALEKVEINALKENVYYATISVTVGDESLSLDSRPSDAIALALALSAPVAIADAVMDQQGVRVDSTDRAGESMKSIVQGRNQEIKEHIEKRAEKGRETQARLGRQEIYDLIEQFLAGEIDRIE